MERLVRDGLLDAVLDITTTEIYDLLVGSNMSADPDRLEAALKHGLPTIISLDAADMVNFGPRETVPLRYRSRKLLEHIASMTLMRTTAEECHKVGEFIVEKLLMFTSAPELVSVWIPRGGVSMITTPGAMFDDREADDMLFNTIRQGLQGSAIKLVDDSRAINDQEFAIDVVNALIQMAQARNAKF